MNIQLGDAFNRTGGGKSANSYQSHALHASTVGDYLVSANYSNHCKDFLQFWQQQFTNVCCFLQFINLLFLLGNCQPQANAGGVANVHKTV